MSTPTSSRHPRAATFYASLGLALALLWPGLAWADPPADAALERGPRIGVQASAGVAGLVGDLGVQGGMPVWDVEISTLYRNGHGGHLGGYLGIDMLTFRAEQQRSEGFYFKEGPVRILSFLYIANLCTIGNPRASVCLGLGEGTVNTNGPRYRADFGTWNYHLRFAWSPVQSMSVVATGRFVGRVEQQVEGVDSAFSYWTSQLGIKYTY